MPTRPYKRKTQPINSDVGKQAAQLDSNMQDVTRFTRKFCGVNHLLQQIGNQLGITQDLKAIFPQDYKQIQSIAQYLLLEENNSLHRFPHWDRLHQRPYNQSITSQRSSDLFASIDEDARMRFFKKQAKRRIENEYWANHSDQYKIYGIRKSIQWGYSQDRRYKKDTLRAKRRAYLHLYFDPERAAKEEIEHNEYLNRLYADLEKGELRDYRSRDYEKYFTVTETPKRGRKITANQEAMVEARKHFGYFALLSNDVKDSFEALGVEPPSL